MSKGVKDDIFGPMKSKIAPAYSGILIFLCLLSFSTLHAQGIRGKVTDSDGVPLPFASIILMGSKQGIASNIEGEYLLRLSPGSHRLRFQYLGYRQLDTIIQVGQNISTINVKMLPEVVELREATVGSKGQDPAYTIIRRAIAKAKYHSMQVDAYNAMVYVKGSGRITKVPGLFKKRITRALAEEGIDSTVAFTQESVSKLYYTRPDQYRDTVISIRTSGDDNNTSPMGFIYSSFYEPKVVNGISPLAPDALSHYRYEYLGYIEDGDHVINKIKVIPKGKGDHVFEGVIYIVDNVWSIHSLDLTTYIWGIKFEMQQQFNPILPDVWLPVHQIYDVSGSFFGFGFEYRYFANLNEFNITLNPDLEVPVIVLDVRVETDEARQAEAKHAGKSYADGLQDLNPGEELSVKQLRRMMKEYEKQEIEALPESDTIVLGSGNKQVIDSSAYKRDSSYWEVVRPMPLTDYEVKGYARLDSIAAIPPEPGDDDDKPQDTVSFMMNEDGFAADIKRRDKFSPMHLITGGRYEHNDHVFLRLKSLLQTINFNTVDGFHAGYGIEIGNKTNKRVNWEVGPFVRYNLARETFNYEGMVRLFGKGWDLKLNGGEQPRQFSYDFPISPWVNTFYTLFVNRNYLKQYEQRFIRGEYEQRITKAMGFVISGEYAVRARLTNHTDLVFFDDKKLLYTSNDPVLLVGDDARLENHSAVISDVQYWIKPFWKYKVVRGTKSKDYSASPRFAFRYRKGWGEDYHPFDFVSANLSYRWPIGAGSLFSMNVTGGKFIGDQKPTYFHDFAHHAGNRLIATPLDPVSMFRMLDYYAYSTNDQYVSGLFNYQFRRFGLTQIEFFRRQGIRENVIFNVLLTPESNQYAELGYGINYIFRFMRIEFVTSWQDYKYQDFAVRFGVATDLQSILGFR